MKKFKNQKFQNSSIATLLRKTFEKGKMVSMRNTKMFLSFLGSLSWRVVILSTLCSLKRSRARVKMIHNFGRYLLNQNRKKGTDYVIAYLKASQLALSKFLAREPLGSLMEVNSSYIFPRLANGLPKIIGPHDRIALRHNNRKTIILWMSIFGVFRVLMGTYALKLSTISNPFGGSYSFLEEKSVSLSGFTQWTIRALPWGVKNFALGIDAIKADKLVLFNTSSPSSRVSWKGVLLDALNLKTQGMDTLVLKWLTMTKSQLAHHFTNLCSMDAYLPSEVIKHSEFVAYASYPESTPMVTLVKLKATSENVDEDPKEFSVPTSTISETPLPELRWPDGTLLNKEGAPSGLCTFGQGESRDDTVHVIRKRWIQHPEVIIIPWPKPKELYDGMEIRFITKPVLQSELDAATIKTTLRDHLSKNEHAVDQVGQLQFVKEPAGKLRTFAMVDVWTQSIMRPVHKLLTSLLRSIPNDGTLDQNASYKRARQKSIAHGCSFGYDLSAATDRLPISIQVSILRGLFEAINIPTDDAITLSLLWKQVLVSRPFLVPKLPKGVEDPQELEGTHLYYAVGQPMGALSSFNMLALTHHMIMQDIASSHGMKGWCELYEITGDDIVIFDAQLAQDYVLYMSSLGLEINQKKSVVSVAKAAGEYLKKTWIKDIDVSMISWKQLYQNQWTLMGRCADALYFLQKWASANIPLPILVRRATLTYDKISSGAREAIDIPLLALLSIALRATKVPLDIFLVFLFDENKPNMSFRRLFGSVKDLTVDRRLAIKLLSDFQEYNKIKPVETRSFLTRYQALAAGPLHGVRKTIIGKILTIQSKLIVGNKLPLSHTLPSLPKIEHLRLTKKSKYLHLAILEKVYSDQFGLNYDLAESVVGAKFVPWAGTLYLRYMMDECVILPEWQNHIKKMRKMIPDFELYVTKSCLDRLSGNQLLDCLDNYVNLESFLQIHLIQDEDRRIAHKANLSLLQSFKLGKDLSPWEEYITMWGRPGEMYGGFPDISQWMVKW